MAQSNLAYYNISLLLLFLFFQNLSQFLYYVIFSNRIRIEDLFIWQSDTLYELFVNELRQLNLLYLSNHTVINFLNNLYILHVQLLRIVVNWLQMLPTEINLGERWDRWYSWCLFILLSRKGIFQKYDMIEWITASCFLY